MRSFPVLQEERRLQSEREFWDAVYEEAEACPQNFEAPDLSDEEGFFNHLITQSEGRRVLSVGGGIDIRAVHLARDGAEVVSVDVSKVACQKTESLAQRYHLQGSLRVLNVSCEELTFDNEFDLVISKGALHHINYEKGVARIEQALAERGELIATEPACLSRTLRAFQRKFPYHPHIKVTPDEIKLAPRELCLLQQTFSKVEFFYFEFLARPSVTYLLSKVGMSRVVPTLKITDSRVIKFIPFVRNYCQHVVIRAKK